MSESSSHERGEEQGDDVFTGQVPCGFLCKLFQQPVTVFVFQSDEAYPVCSYSRNLRESSMEMESLSNSKW